MLDDAAKGVLDCRIVAFYKVMFDEANSERRFTYNGLDDGLVVSDEMLWRITPNSI